VRRPTSNPCVGNCNSRSHQPNLHYAGTWTCTKGDGQGRADPPGQTNLAGVHLKLAHDLDGDLAVLAGGITCSVDVAEGAVAHLLDQLPALEAGVLRQLALGLTLLGDDALEYGGVDVPSRGAGGGGRLELLLVAGRAGCDVAGLCGYVAVIEGADGEVAMGRDVVLLLGLVHDRLADTGVVRLRVGISRGLVLCVDVGDVCGGLAVGGVTPGLLAMTQEVLEVLYCGHLSRVRAAGGCVGNFGGGRGSAR
jgi:hypothetical protein